MTDSKAVADFEVERSGGLFLFRPQNEAAKQHLRDHVGEEAQWWAGALVVEHRFARELADKLIEQGFVVE